MNRREAPTNARQARSNQEQPASPGIPRRPRFQFSLLGLFILTFVTGAVAAPGFYLFRGSSELPQGRLVGMLMMLAGPLLVMSLLSVLLSLFTGNEEE